MTYWCILLYCEMHHRPRWNERTTMDDVVSSVRLNTPHPSGLQCTGSYYPKGAPEVILVNVDLSSMKASRNQQKCAESLSSFVKISAT